MSISKEVYNLLQATVGKEWVSDDPAVCEADRYCSLGTGTDEKRRPAVSVLPSSTEEVQAIVKIANKYNIPFLATSTHFTPYVFCEKDDMMFIDLKRINEMKIDFENMYAVVGSGTNFSDLQAELFKKGLFTFLPGCGGQCSVVANTINMGDAPLGWRLGLGYQRLLGIEWVLPNGEILKMGSLSTNDDYFWGEGPGPDLRGLLRGCSGHKSKMGIVTRIGVKVFPFVKEKLEPYGLGCHTFLKLPENRFKWFNIRFNKREDAVKAMIEIGKCELGLVLMTVPPVFMAIARSRGDGCGGYWERWNSMVPKLDPESEMIRVLLYGIGSEKRLAYEENVLMDIVSEFKGSAREGAPRDETNFMAADAICACVVGGKFISEISYESINQAVRYSKGINEITSRYVPRILDDKGTTNWISPYEIGYITKYEGLRMASVENADALNEWRKETHEYAAKAGAYTNIPEPEIFGPVWGNYQIWEEKFKKLFDPNNVSAPEKTRN
jgi:hypothetical protein